MLSKLLSGAVKLYLRSQVEGVKDLQVKIIGKNKQIWQGYIPQVLLSCHQAIYQGLHLSQIGLQGENIAINLPEVIKGHPLKLLEPIFVEIQVQLNPTDLQASLNSALLQTGLADLWQMILDYQEFNQLNPLAKLTARTSPRIHSGDSALIVKWQSMAIAKNKLNLTGIVHNPAGETSRVTLSTGIELANSHTLCLSPLEITSDLLDQNCDRQLKIDLGTDLALEKLTIVAEGILCCGKIKINN